MKNTRYEIGEIKYDEHCGRVRARAWVTYPDSSRKRESGHGENRRMAAESLRRKISEKCDSILYGYKCSQGDISIMEAVKLRIESLEYIRKPGADRPIRPESNERNSDCYKNLILPFPIAKLNVKDVTAADLIRYRKELEEAQYDACQKKSPHTPKMKFYHSCTLNRAVKLVRDVVDECYVNRGTKSPTDCFTSFNNKKKNKTENNFLLDEEVDSAIQFFQKKRQEGKYALDSVYADLFTLALVTGMRPGELRGLKKMDWDSKNRMISVKRTGSYHDGRTKTENSKRIIPAIDIAKTVLDRRCEKIRMENYVFPNTKGEVISANNLDQKFKNWLKEFGNGKTLTPHSLRGSCCSYLISKEVSLEIIAAILGHDSVKTTESYYTFVSNRMKMKEIMSKIDGTLSSISENRCDF